MIDHARQLEKVAEGTVALGPTADPDGETYIDLPDYTDSAEAFVPVARWSEGDMDSINSGRLHLVNGEGPTGVWDGISYYMTYNADAGHWELFIHNETTSSSVNVQYVVFRAP